YYYYWTRYLAISFAAARTSTRRTLWRSPLPTLRSNAASTSNTTLSCAVFSICLTCILNHCLTSNAALRCLAHYPVPIRRNGPLIIAPSLNALAAFPIGTGCWAALRRQQSRRGWTRVAFRADVHRLSSQTEGRDQGTEGIGFAL